MTAAFTLRLSEATLEALGQLDGKIERSRSWLATGAAEDYVALNAWQIGKIEAEIAAADRGVFASDEELRAWWKYSARVEDPLDPPRTRGPGGDWRFYRAR